ncbi:MAG: zf-HC2 domain-containing protein [Ilumatobacter sp.]|uniref:zf-HC2 domain-containing protein n=1 Tax=Ilumatobacter sp. TaxID=1967498 RepID=UPI003298E000
MNSWHVDERALRAYAERELVALERASVEAHVMGCGSCRGELGRVARGWVGTVSFEDLWGRVQTRVEVAPSVRTARWLQRIGVADSDTVVVRQIARQCLQWTIAATLVLALAALAATLGLHDSAQLGFVLIAPLLPALGVAATYRLTPTTTAALEITSPYSPARLLLWRTGYAVATAVPASVAFGAVIPGDPWMAVAWLLPGGACTALVLVAATWTDPVRPAVVVAVSWLGIVASWQVRHVPDAVVTPSTQLLSLAVALAAGAVFARRLLVLRVPVL